MAERASKKRRMYVRQGRKYASLLRKWAEKGDPNVTHRLRFLDAQCAAFQGRTIEAIQLYRESIRIVSRLGYNNDHALFRERFGSYLLSKDTETAYRYLANAH